jgi:hypothetical protein
MPVILPDWNLEQKLHLIRVAYGALPAGGAFIVIENLIDEARRENAFGAATPMSPERSCGPGRSKGRKEPSE